MSNETMTLAQASSALGLSKSRIYQLDAELSPLISRRGATMKTRMYDPQVVQAYIAWRNAKKVRLETSIAVIDTLVRNYVVDAPGLLMTAITDAWNNVLAELGRDPTTEDA